MVQLFSQKSTNPCIFVIYNLISSSLECLSAIGKRVRPNFKLSSTRTGKLSFSSGQTHLIERPLLIAIDPFYILIKTVHANYFTSVFSVSHGAV